MRLVVSPACGTKGVAKTHKQAMYYCPRLFAFSASSAYCQRSAGARQASRMLSARAAVRAAATGARLHSFSRHARRHVAAAVMAGDGTLKVMLLHPLMGLDTLGTALQHFATLVADLHYVSARRGVYRRGEVVLTPSSAPHIATERCA